MRYMPHPSYLLSFDHPNYILYSVHIMELVIICVCIYVCVYVCMCMYVCIRVFECVYVCIPDRLWGTSSLLYNGYRGSFPEVKARPGRDTDHSPHLVPKSRMIGSHTSSTTSAFMACNGTASVYMCVCICTCVCGGGGESVETYELLWVR
jgi:hypothetical protein